MKTLNKLLQRQVEKYWKNLGAPPADLLPFLEIVSDSYDHYEKDRKMLERSIEITSSEMIQLNNKIRNDAKQWNILINNMEEVFFSVDVEQNKTLSMSVACQKVYGYPAAAFEENSNLWYEVVLEEDKGIIMANYPTMEAGKSFAQQYRIHHKDGSIRWIESKINPSLNAKGQLVRIDGVTADITKRKEAEEALLASEQKLRTLIRNSADVISISDQNGQFLFISDSVTDYAGFKKEEVIGRKISEFVHPGDAAAFELQALQLFEQSGNSITVELRLRTKSGKYEWCEGVLTNLLSDPAIKGVVANLRVITERKIAGEILKTNNEELKKRNSELDKFVYSVSHDLRAPLRSILGIVELSEGCTTETLMLKHLDMIKGSVKRLDGFILDILDYSRNSRMEIRKEDVSFKEILTDVVGNLKYMGDTTREVDIQVQINNGVCFKSDKSRIATILNNLVSNAIRYQNPKVDRPFVAVNVDLTKEEAKIVVKDNGIGIRKEHQEKIFEMFYRVSSDSVGSGLGLYIVKETVSKLNGGLEIESEPDEGTAIKISIPNLTK